MVKTISLETQNVAYFGEPISENNPKKPFSFQKLPIDLQLDIISRGDFDSIRQMLQAMPSISRSHGYNLWEPIKKPLYAALGSSLPPLTPSFETLCREGLKDLVVEKMSPSTRGAAARILIDKCAKTVLYKQLRGDFDDMVCRVKTCIENTMNATQRGIPYIRNADAWKAISACVEQLAEYLDIIACHEQEHDTDLSAYPALLVKEIRNLVIQQAEGADFVTLSTIFFELIDSIEMDPGWHEAIKTSVTAAAQRLGTL